MVKLAAQLEAEEVCWIYSPYWSTEPPGVWTHAGHEDSFFVLNVFLCSLVPWQWRNLSTMFYCRGLNKDSSSPQKWLPSVVTTGRATQLFHRVSSCETVAVRQRNRCFWRMSLLKNRFCDWARAFWGQVETNGGFSTVVIRVCHNQQLCQEEIELYSSSQNARTN